MAVKDHNGVENIYILAPLTLVFKLYITAYHFLENTLSFLIDFPSCRQPLVSFHLIKINFSVS